MLSRFSSWRHERFLFCTTKILRYHLLVSCFTPYPMLLENIIEVCFLQRKLYDPNYSTAKNERLIRLFCYKVHNVWPTFRPGENITDMLTVLRGVSSWQSEKWVNVCQPAKVMIGAQFWSLNLGVYAYRMISCSAVFLTAWVRALNSKNSPGDI